MSTPKTLYDKIWDAHIVHSDPDGTCLLYIDRHLVHEVTSPQAFESLRIHNRKVRRPDLTIATVDHNITTDDTRTEVIKDEIARKQVDALENNLNNLEMKIEVMQEVIRKIVSTDFSKFSNRIYEDHGSR